MTAIALAILVGVAVIVAGWWWCGRIERGDV